MTYTIINNDQSYDLIPYDLKIAEELEKIELLNAGSQAFKEKCRGMYKLFEKVLGKEAVLETLGKFEIIDPNDINILYLKIVKAYNKPLTDYQAEQVNDSLDDAGLDKILEVMKAIPQMQELKNK